MTTTNFRHGWVLALSVLCACELPPDLLEAGDGDGGSSGDTGDTSGDTGDTGDTGEPEPDEVECVEQGSNVYGESEPEWDFLLETCEVDCADGWGHDVPWLESEWTRPSQIMPDETTRGALAITSDDRIAMVLSGPDQSYQVHWLSPEGTLPSFQLSSSPISGEVIDFGIDAEQDIYYFVWTDGATQRLVATAESSQVVFDVELGPHDEYNSRLAVLDDGVIVSLDDGDPRLMRFNQAGDLLFEHPIPATSTIDVSPSGDVIVLANTTTLSWVDMQGNFLGDQAVDNVASMLGLVAVDDTHVVVAGGEPVSGGDSGAFLREFGALGPGWSHSYDRADAWCVESDAQPTQELFTQLVQLGDGTLVVAGVETDNSPGVTQPWIAHVSVAGDVLAFDRGLWRGDTIDLVARDNVAYVLLTKTEYVGGIGEPYVRKYEF